MCWIECRKNMYYKKPSSSYVTPAGRIGSSQDWQKLKRLVFPLTQELFPGWLNVQNLYGQKV
jgi:hypothetical protein